MTYYEIFNLISDAVAITGEQLSADEFSQSIQEFNNAWGNGAEDWNGEPTKEQGVALVAIGLKVLSISKNREG